MKRGFALLLALLLTPVIVGQGHAGSCTCGSPARLSTQWEIEHTDSDYVFAAGEQFARWNAYVDMFSYGNGDGVSGPNGVNEILFLDRATAASKYGLNLGRDVFAVTYMAPLSASGEFDFCPTPPEAKCGTFAETDVVLNSDFVRGFKPGGPPDFEDRGPALYGATVAHELGHALGFHHNFQNLSVMNYYEDYAAQYIATADTQEARRAYPQQARTVTDLAAYPFYFDPALTDYAATTAVTVSPLSLAQGGVLTLRNFGLENVGSETVSSLQLRFYLSADATITTSDILAGTLLFTGPVPSGAFWDDGSAGRSFRLSSDVPPGTYFVGALVTDGAGGTDAISYNNGWVAPQQVTIARPELRRRAVRN